MDDYISNKFNEVFDEVYINLKIIIAEDPNYQIKDMENLLNDLYVIDGNNLMGRGEIQDTILYATIIAIEIVLSEWKNETKR